MPRLLIALIVAFSVSSVACTDDCDTLVDQVCSRLGEQHDACQRARKRKETATADDKRMCGEALALTQRLTPNN